MTPGVEQGVTAHRDGQSGCRGRGIGSRALQVGLQLAGLSSAVHETYASVMRARGGDEARDVFRSVGRWMCDCARLYRFRCRCIAGVLSVRLSVSVMRALVVRRPRAQSARCAAALASLGAAHVRHGSMAMAHAVTLCREGRARTGLQRRGARVRLGRGASLTLSGAAPLSAVVCVSCTDILFSDFRVRIFVSLSAMLSAHARRGPPGLRSYSFIVYYTL